MIVFTDTITPRLRYITDFIGREITGQPFQLTDDANKYEQISGTKLNYSCKAISDDEFRFIPHTLLFETNIRQQQIDVFNTGEYKAFFKTSGDFPFDIFAASFYLLSRYEEYLPHKKDMYGRYAHENSLAFKENFLDKPLINIWLQYFKQTLISRFPNSTFPNPSFTFLPTYDIDEAYCFQHKQWIRTAGAAIKDILKGKWGRSGLRQRVLKGKAEDPFDSYSWINDLHSHHTLMKPRYFFLVSEKTGKYDRNILPAKKALKVLIKNHSGKYDIGVHPSWQSGNDAFLIKKEKETIESIANIKVISSRQHFIRFTLPHTFRQLIDAGIKEDFSIGYGSINGFRASVASPFYWYDLEREQTTNLLLYPFCYMEANSFYEQKYSSGQALEEMFHFYNEVKKVNGTLITIWHNTFLGTDEKFRGWREVYKQFFEKVSG